MRKRGAGRSIYRGLLLLTGNRAGIGLKMGPRLTGMMRAVHDRYYGQGMTQEQIAAELNLRHRQAVSGRLMRIRRRYVRAGLTPPPNPGTGLRLVRCVGLPEYN